MSFKRSFVVIAVVLMLAMTIGACAKQEEAEWALAVEGAARTEFSSADCSVLTPVKIDTVLKTKDGSETEQVWEGVLLKDVINDLGVSEYSSITLTASDGYSKDYTADIVNDERTILGTSLDGNRLSKDEGFVQAVAGSQGGNMWIKQLISIKVNK